MPPTNNESTKDVQPLVVQAETPILNSDPLVAPIIKPIVAPVSAPKPNQKPSIVYPKDKLSELARTPLNEHCSAVLVKNLPEKLGDPGKFLIPCDFLRMDECLALADLIARINLMPLSVRNKLSLPELSPTCMTLDLANRSISRRVGVAEDVFVKVGTFHLPTDFVVVDFDADPRVSLILGRSFLKTERALIDVFEGELTLRVGKEAITFNLDQTSRYLTNYNDMTKNRIDVIDMACEEYSQEVLGFSDVIASGNPILYYDPSVPTSSPTLTPFEDSDFLLKEVDAFLALEDDPTSPKADHFYFDTEGDILLLEAFLNDDPSLPPPNQGNYLPQGGFTIVKNEENELIPTRLVTRWRVCIDYRKLNEATRKDHFPPPFMDQMLKRLAGNEYYCLLDGFSGYFQIPIDLKDQEKTTFTCPYGTFAYRRMPFGLCNAPGTFQRCMMAIFHDMIEKTMKVFMDDFSVFRNSSSTSLSHLEKMLKRCEDTNLLSKLGEESLHDQRGHRTTPFRSKSMRIKSSGGVFMARKPLTFSRLATMDPPGDIMAQTTLPRRFKTPRAIISDRDTHFCIDEFAKVMLKYGVTHHLATAYHLQTSKQVKVSNRGFKRILKRTLGENRASWSDKLNDALWAFCIAFKTPIECTLYKFVYVKACDLPIELEHKACWALKHANFTLQTAGDHKKVQLNELNEFRDQAFQNSLIYKEKTKMLHDSKIKDRVFNIGDRVLLFNSRWKIFSGKLKTRWSRPFTINHVFPYGTVELS
nr:reverse transcriptase domain-containing protein [Tanacetum cinerariifolium]